MVASSWRVIGHLEFGRRKAGVMLMLHEGVDLGGRAWWCLVFEVLLHSLVVF